MYLRGYVKRLCELNVIHVDMSDPNWRWALTRYEGQTLVPDLCRHERATLLGTPVRLLCLEILPSGSARWAWGSLW